eukprot:scaffold32363_cov33-Prasinocladus_malaysianus.AAC.1
MTSVERVRIKSLAYPENVPTFRRPGVATKHTVKCGALKNNSLTFALVVFNGFPPLATVETYR